MITKKSINKKLYIGVGIGIVIVLMIVFIMFPKINHFANTTIKGQLQPVKTVSNNNISLNGLKEIEGVKLVDGDRILVRNQDRPIENGIYRVSSGNWSRTDDFPNGGKVEGAFVLLDNKKYITTNDVNNNEIGKNDIIFISTNPKEYVSVGYGMAFDKGAIDNFIKFSTNKKVPYGKVENGKPIVLDIQGRTIRNSMGISPPSFAFYPFGMGNQGYNPNLIELSEIEKNIGFLNLFGVTNNTSIRKTMENNLEKGDKICKDYCSKTKCTAVQTRVMENCLFDGTCGKDCNENCNPDVSPGSCTLYYRTIEDADDAYYNIYSENTNKVGRKYYELGSSMETPTYNYTPTNSPVKWCPPDTKVDNKKYQKSPTARSDCTCTNNTEVCLDINCCKTRNLLTTKSAQANTSIYQIPINVFTQTELTGKNKDGSCCGKCDGKYSSCLGEKKTGWDLVLTDGCDGFTPGYDVNEAGVKTKRSCAKCGNFDKDTKFDKDTDGQIYIRNLPTNKKDKPNFNAMAAESCWFRYNMVAKLDIQSNCTEDNPQHGCSIGPPIISMDNSTNEIIPCNDPMIENVRCNGNGICNGFPYHCQTEKSGTLWLPK